MKQSGMKKIGEWNKVKNLIGNLAYEMKKAQIISLKQWSLKAEGIAKGHMSSQDLGWTDLQPSTLANKVRKGLSSNILIATSDYFQSITSWVDEGEYTAYAGVDKKARNAEGEVIADIAAAHEFGVDSINLPDRPLWRPTFAEVMKWYKQSDSRPDIIFVKNIKKYGV